MNRTTQKYVGELKITEEQASKQLAAQWESYHAALNAVGDVLKWEGSSPSGERSEQLKKDLGYFVHSESTPYEEYEKSNTERYTRTEYSSSLDDEGHSVTVYEEVFVPKSVIMETSECLKVVRRGSANTVKKLEKKFFHDADDYYSVKEGFSTELPKKKLHYLYNTFLLLSGVFFVIYLLLSPAILPDYARSLSADLLLFNLLGIMPLTSAPAWLSYVSFSVGVVCSLTFFTVRTKYSPFGTLPNYSGAFISLCSAVASFGLGFLMKEKSNNPIMWVPVALYCAGRPLCIIMAAFSVVKSVVNFCTGYPHKYICGKITSNTERLNNYIDSGRYAEDETILAEILSYNVVADFKRINEIMTKIRELDGEKNKLIRKQEEDFTDESAKIGELNVRIKKACAALAKETDKNAATKNG